MDLAEVLETGLSNLVTTTAETLEQSQSELASQLENHLLSKSESADSAVEATEEILEDLESKVCSDDEKENVNVCVEENIISNCDINGDTEKKTDIAVYKGEDSSDRINLAEIKI